MGPSLGYYPNAEKTILVVKPEQMNEAKLVFEETGVVITAKSARYLGTTLGSKKFENQFLTNRADKIGKQLEKLSGIASIHLQAAYAGFTVRFLNKWNFLAHTVDTFSIHVHCLEKTIENQFIPALLGLPCNPNLRDILRLPCRLGGLDIQKPVMSTPGELTSSFILATPLMILINEQQSSLTVDTSHEQAKQKHVFMKNNENVQKNIFRTLYWFPLATKSKFWS